MGVTGTLLTLPTLDNKEGTVKTDQIQLLIRHSPSRVRRRFEPWARLSRPSPPETWTMPNHSGTIATTSSTSTALSSTAFASGSSEARTSVKKRVRPSLSLPRAAEWLNAVKVLHVVLGKGGAFPGCLWLRPGGRMRVQGEAGRGVS